MIRRPLVTLLACLLVVTAFGCASTGRVQQQLEAQMRLGDYATAVQTVETERERAYRGKNRLLYYLERGMLLHLSGRYAESNAAFENAKQVGSELYAASITGTGLSLMTNDYALDYAGENFERTLIHLFSALNYEQLGEVDSALVEIRQVGDYLRKLQVDSTNDNTYQEDAFARYLGALFYELGGEYDAALVDYKKALDAYDTYAEHFAVSRPPSLFANAERVAGRLGRWARDDLRDRGSSGVAREIPDGHGELVILHYNGLAPIKDQEMIVLPFNEAWAIVLALQLIGDDQAQQQIARATTYISMLSGVDVVPVAFPKYVSRPYSIAAMEPRLAAATQITGPELVEDIGAIAEKDLADRRARIYAKAVARAAIKYAIQKGAEEAARQASNGDQNQALLVAGTQLLGTIGRFATEQADKRVWSTLPDEIWMTSMIVPAGRHDLEVDFLTAQAGLVESQSVSGIEVPAGGRRFVILRTVK
ncbi:MAG: hypothetical protein NXI30_01005 [bacterium]|nr:hypothetical protein [bacterium]